MEAKRKRHLGFKISAIFASSLAVIFLALSILSFVCFPKTYAINSSNSEPVVSLVSDTDLYYATTTSINKASKKNELIASYNLIEDVNAKYSLDVDSIKSLYEADNGKLIAISQNASDGYLFSLNKSDLSLDGYAKYSGDFLRLASSNDDLVVASKNGKYTLYSRYKLSSLSSGIYKSGYYYRITQNSDRSSYDLNRNVSITTLDIAIKDNYLYAINSAGISVMDLDFTYNNFHTEQVKAKWNDDSFISAYGVKGTPTKDEITLDSSSFRANATYYDAMGLSISGGFLRSSQNAIYYVGTDNILYSVAFKDIRSKRPDGSISDDKIQSYPEVVFPTLVETDGCFFYDDEIEAAYVIYKASDNVSKLAFADDLPTIEFTLGVEFNIVYMVTDHTANYLAFLSNNSTKSEAGVYLAKYLDPVSYKNFEWTKTAVIYFAVFFALFLVVSIISWVGAFKKDSDKKILKTFHDIWKSKFVYLAMAPSLILLVMFCYYPAIASIGLSFFDYTKENPTFNWNNFENYKYVFTDPAMLGAFKNMFLFLLVDIVTAVLPPLIFAFFLSTMKNEKLSKVMRTLLFIPGIIPGIAGNLIWKEAILGNFGVINECIEACGGSVISFLAQSSTAKWSLLLVGFPYVGSYIIFYGGMMNIPKSYYEACELEGVGPWRRFVKIDIPLVFPQLKYVFVCSIINSMQNFARVQSITNGAYDTNVPVLEMYDQIMDGNYGKASAVASIIFVLLFFATYFTMKQKKKEMKV